MHISFKDEKDDKDEEAEKTVVISMDTEDSTNLNFM